MTTTHTWKAEQQKYPRDADYYSAKGGLFELIIATHDILGGEPEAGQVFMYLFRRFGYPKFGWDGDKTLVQYHLTTPMDGVILTVEPNVTGGSTFGYSLREDINCACEEEERTPYDDWMDRFEAWVKKEHGIEIIRLFDQDNDKLQRVWRVWAADKQERDFVSEIDIHNAFFTDQEIIRKKYLAMYQEARDPFVPLPLINDRSDDSIMKQVHTAQCSTIKDLLRPVFVRDVMIDIKGEVPWSEISGIDNAVDCALEAGVGVGDALNIPCEGGEKK